MAIFSLKFTWCFFLIVSLGRLQWDTAFESWVFLHLLSSSSPLDCFQLLCPLITPSLLDKHCLSRLQLSPFFLPLCLADSACPWFPLAAPATPALGVFAFSWQLIAFTHLSCSSWGWFALLGSHHFFSRFLESVRIHDANMVFCSWKKNVPFSHHVFLWHLSYLNTCWDPCLGYSWAIPVCMGRQFIAMWILAVSELSLAGFCISNLSPVFSL